jgi:hypothetical protein
VRRPWHAPSRGGAREAASAGAETFLLVLAGIVAAALAMWSMFGPHLWELI